MRAIERWGRETLLAYTVVVVNQRNRDEALERRKEVVTRAKQVGVMVCEVEERYDDVRSL